MRLVHRLEFAFGLMTLLSGAVVVAISFGTDSYAAKPTSNLRDFLMVVLISAVLPSLTAIASYAHGIRDKAWGFYVLCVCGIAMAILLSLLIYVILLAWYYPPWLMLVSVMPYLTGLLTVTLALLARIK